MGLREENSKSLPLTFTLSPLTEKYWLAWLQYFLVLGSREMVKVRKTLYATPLFIPFPLTLLPLTEKYWALIYRFDF